MPFEHQSLLTCVIFIHFCYTLPRARFPHRGFEVIFAILEAGYYTPDLHQDTQFLLSASLLGISWSLPAHIRLF